MRSFFRFTGIGINSAVSVPDVFARITRDVKSWIKGVAHGTQDSDVICSAESRCDDGWTHYRDHCYMHFAEKRMFHRARGICRRNYSDLVSVYDQQTKNFISSLSGRKLIWIVGNDRFPNEDPNDFRRKREFICQYPL